MKREQQPTTLRQYLQKQHFPKALLPLVPTGFDVVGDIAIFADMPDVLEGREKEIANALLALQKNIRVVCKKTGQYAGKYRTPRLKILAGQRRKETVHKESGVRLKLHVEKVYFSARTGTERLRIAKQVRTGEEILVMFSGCAPFCSVLSKNAAPKHIVGIEINPVAHQYGLENVRLNKLTNVELRCGDVRDIVPKLKKKFDRILMPLPKSAEDYLALALRAARKGTIIHFYDFLREEDIPAAAVAKIDAACRKAKKKYKVARSCRCGQFSPATFRVCVDFEVC